MTKPNFQEMSRQELRSYILVNREDDDAIAEIIHRIEAGNAPTHSYPRTEEDLRAMQEILREKLERNQEPNT
jgi:hypothetical protein